MDIFKKKENDLLLKKGKKAGHSDAEMREIEDMTAEITAAVAQAVAEKPAEEPAEEKPKGLSLGALKKKADKKAAKSEKPEKNTKQAVRIDLKKELGAKTPAKKQINLIVKEKKSFFTPTRIAAGAIALAVVIGAGAYGVLKLQSVRSLERRLETSRQELASLQVLSAEYDAVQEEYIKYSTAYQTEEETKIMDSRILIDKARELVDPYGYITSLSFNGNELEITIFSRDIAKVTDSLHNDPDDLVKYVIPRSESKEDETLSENAESTASFRLVFEKSEEVEQK